MVKRTRNGKKVRDGEKKITERKRRRDENEKPGSLVENDVHRQRRR